MNSDDFEKRLELQTIRQIPGDWRREILQQAKSVSPSQLKTENSKLKIFLSELLWPCPQAWAGVAAVWLVILTLNFAMREPKIEIAKAAPPSPEEIAVLRTQRRLYWELAGLNTEKIVESPKPTVPGPRSEGRKETEIV